MTGGWGAVLCNLSINLNALFAPGIPISDFNQGIGINSGFLFRNTV